ncbi:MAG: RNA methyltransferase [Gammaproteobacteria bacterium]|nr:RNA methyltransferase [Gammaproteobacteria bacterium]MCH9744645.1 RNA methyltransferase [Gammaproteobacteria bacterium]
MTKALLQQHNTQDIIDKLGPYLTELRRQRIEQVISSRLESIQLAIESPSDINNALAAIRTCEALGISKIHIISQEGGAKAIKNITQGAFYWVDIQFYKDLDAFLLHAKQQPLNIAGGCVTATEGIAAVPVERPLCILIGNEQRGLSSSAQQACDYRYRIPMYGMSESMNLSVSAAISLYDTSSRKRTLINATGDLNTEQRTQLRAQYYLHSTTPRLAQALMHETS